MTEAQRAALALGRKNLAAKRAASASPADPAALPSPRPDRQPAAADSPNSRPPATTSSASSVTSSSTESASAAPSLDADTLAFVFDSASAEPNSAASDGKPAGGGVLSSLFSRGTTSTPRSPSPSGTSLKPTAAEEEIARATDLWSETVRDLFIFAAVLIVGQELKPTEDEAQKIVIPLVRIVMRHYDPLRQSSNDMLDLFTAIVAGSLYVQRIWPDYKARKAEEKVRVFRGNTPRVVPIERGSASVAQPASASASANAGRGVVDAASAAAGSRGLRADAVYPDAGPVSSAGQASGPAASGDGLTAEAIVEGFIGGSL